MKTTETVTYTLELDTLELSTLVLAMSVATGDQPLPSLDSSDSRKIKDIRMQLINLLVGEE